MVKYSIKERIFYMETSNSQTPFSAKLKLPPQKQKNVDLRTREFLSVDEIDQIRKAARDIGRHGHRDDTLILIMFRHGLRVGEVAVLRWEQIDFKQGFLYINRLKNGSSSTHPLRGVEIRALRKLKRDYDSTEYVFVSERNAPLTQRTVQHIIARAGDMAKLGFPIHPHMLRHSTGFYLANKGHDTRAIQAYLGHKNIKNTVMYTALSHKRFNNFWND